VDLETLKFGLRVPSFPADGSTEREFINQIQRFLRELEENFDSAWICDHFIPWADFVPMNTSTLEGFTTIGYLSSVCRKLIFGNIVLCNSYRNPALLAKMGTTLQTLTRGRFILGIGAGWRARMERKYNHLQRQILQY
jgi:alkanesulfonate monooxygenase SsuD/methylene tetrahydromethanopterin reductase-like flavin-dependent oxidoreductase (luciferase family)